MDTSNRCDCESDARDHPLGALPRSSPVRKVFRSIVPRLRPKAVVRACCLCFRAEPTAAELAGYCDGTLDGAADRVKAQPFQVEKTANYRTAGQGYLEANANPEVYVKFYRKAYSNGYQQGYYLQQQ